MKKMKKKRKMKKRCLFLICFALILFISTFSQANAACVIQGYAKDGSGTSVSSDIRAYCELDDSWKNITRNAEDMYGVSWGGPADTCQSYCDNVYINGSNSTLGIWGYPSPGYPMDSSNTPNWGNSGAHNYNITLYEHNAPLAEFGTNVVNGLVPSGNDLTFDSRCSDDSGVDFLLIYGNWSSWGIKATNSSPTNYTWWNITINNIPDGTWAWAVYCNDTTAGTSDWTDTNRTFTIDTGAPAITIISPSAVEYKTLSIWFNVTASETADWCGYSLDSNANVTMTNSTGNWNNLNSSMTKESHSVTFYCNDSVGNVGSALRSFSVDNTSPIITIQSPLNMSYSYAAPHWFNVTLDENISWCGYSLDGASNQTMTNNSQIHYYYQKTAAISEGQHHVNFYCNDTAGNMGAAGSRYFTIDLTNPAAYTNNPTDGSAWASSQTVTFDLKCTDNLGVSTLVLYGNWSGAWAIEQINSSPINNTWWNLTETISNGIYMWAAYCNDTSGRVNITENVTFRVAYSSGGGGGGGGGGGNIKISKEEIKFSYNPELIKISLIKGEKSEVEMNIQSLDERDIYFNLSLDISGVSLSESNFVLKPNEKRKILVLFSSEPESGPEPGIYLNYLIIGAKTLDDANKTEKVPIVFVINAENKLFNISLTVLPEYKRIFSGHPVSSQIELYNLGLTQSPIDVKLVYRIQDYDGNTIITSDEPIIVHTRVFTAKNLIVPPSAKPGAYLFTVTATYNETNVFALDSFIVKKSIDLTWLYLLLGLLIIILIILYFIKKRRRKRKDKRGTKRLKI
ncbi:MAG: hypothetical protein NTX24_05240 [Candidatus Pacearchaeota archaeon]|nr:hypothetical protein [Candidatus Pacearchaeota archaeon]